MILRQTNEAREKAIAAGARDLDQPFQEIEKQYLKLLEAIENNNIGYARDNAQKIEQGFRTVEIMAIKYHALDPVRRMMEQARQQGVDRVTPQAYSQAMDRLTAADQFIDQNPYAKQAIADHVAQAVFMAQRMMAVANSCKRFQAMSPEESALFAEEQIGELGRALDADDVRNLELADQVSALAKAARNLKAANQASNELNQSYRAQIEAMEQRIAGLQGFSRQQEATTARLAAEREFNKRFDQVQGYFSSAEAEVYKQGNELVIRMRGIKFPVGQATLSPENYHLLSKVQRAIHTFDQGSIVIEGHTDSTGSAQLNQQLSLQRAEAVKAYLSANDPDIADRIKASGYGSDRPLASNNTAEGRAVNRRIDVRITPKQTH
jgi:outer membrane protein OmpA-like peptidoglycan-associated protein